MTSTISHRFDTPCGFEVWLIPVENRVKCRVFFTGSETTMDKLSGNMSKDGWLMLADKIREVLR